MTMHLVRGMSTTSTKKRKMKRKPGWKAAISEHEEFMKRMGVKGKSNYRSELPDLSTGPRVTSDKIPGNGCRKQSNKYSGEEIMGIVTTHKSNIMPVSNKRDAVAASQMRR